MPALAPGERVLVAAAALGADVEVGAGMDELEAVKLDGKEVVATLDEEVADELEEIRLVVVFSIAALSTPHQIALLYDPLSATDSTAPVRGST
jgi:hypothetical protein